MFNILDFEAKRLYFLNRLKQIKTEEYVSLEVNRDTLFIDSFNKFSELNQDKLRGKEFKIEFTGEDGYDAGGPKRDFFSDLSKKIFS
jgi:hypothetical protein